MVFPHAFGFVPRTQAADGDPEDILILMDEPTFTGCVIQTRLLGVMEAEQTEDGKTERNDRANRGGRAEPGLLGNEKLEGSKQQHAEGNLSSSSSRTTKKRARSLKFFG